MAKKEVSRTRSVAFVGLTVALLSVSAWVTVPLGPVPFTLQTFVEVFALVALSRNEAIATSAVYLALGAVGLPVFSGMRGGIGVIAGPTGGFLWGFLLGTIVAAFLLAFWRRAEDITNPRRRMAQEYVCAGLFLVIVYVCGWVQLAAVSGMGLAGAFAAGVAPFIVIDIIKIALAVPVAHAVRAAVGD